MRKNFGMPQWRLRHRSLARLLGRLGVAFAVGAAALTAPAPWAGWNAQ